MSTDSLTCTNYENSEPYISMYVLSVKLVYCTYVHSITYCKVLIKSVALNKDLKDSYVNL